MQQSYGVNALNQVTSAGSTNFGYDARGRLNSDGINSYSYTKAGSQLVQVGGSNGTANLGYDGLHRLAQTQAPGTTRFGYDSGTAIEERDGSGNILRRYVPGADGSPLVWYEGSDTSNPRWLLKDQQGSVIAVANSAGQSVATNTYDAYGMPGPNNVGRFQYAGYMFVPEVGLYNTGARTYSPTLGRFLQTDPIGYGDGMNWYAYTHGDPVNGTDPSGLCPGGTGPSGEIVVIACNNSIPTELGGFTSVTSTILDSTPHAINNLTKGIYIPGLKPQGKTSNPSYTCRALVAAAAANALNELEPGKNLGQYVTQRDDNFANYNGPDLSKLPDFSPSYTTHGSAVESGRIPDHPEFSVKQYNDPSRGSVIAVVYPTDMLDHLLTYPLYALGLDPNSGVARRYYETGCNP